MRLIDADALSEVLNVKNNCEGCDYQQGMFCSKSSDFVNACEAIFDAPTIESEPRWIPCSERLPEIGGLYIVCGKQKYTWENDWSYFVDAAECVEPDEGYIDCWTTWNDWDEGQENHIIAWLPLPEPYKGEDDAKI